MKLFHSYGVFWRGYTVFEMVFVQWVIKPLRVRPLALKHTLQTSPVTSDCCLVRTGLCAVVTASGLQLGTSHCLFCHFSRKEKKKERMSLVLFCLAAWPWMCGEGGEEGGAWPGSVHNMPAFYFLLFSGLLFITLIPPACAFHIFFPLYTSILVPALVLFCSFCPVARKNCFNQTTLTMEFWNKRLNMP